MRSSLVVLNAKAGSMADAPAVEARIRRAFALEGSDVELALVVPDEIGRAVLDGVRSGREVVFVGGGDGTLATAARSLVGTPTALGVLPLGTKNHFARDLGIPLDIEEAVAALSDGRRTDVDLGTVNGLPFINNVSIGLYPMAVKHREWRQKRLGVGRGMATAYAVLNVLWRYPIHALRISWEGERKVLRTPFVLIGNNEYTTSAEDLGRRASLTDGRLCGYYAHRVGRARLLWAAVRALFGVMEESPDLQRIVASQILVESRRSELHVAIDGEVRTLRTPLEFGVLRHALCVLAPKIAP